MTVRPRYVMTAEELGLFTQQTPTRVLHDIDQSACLKLASGGVGIPPSLVRAYLIRRGLTYTPRIIAHINLKGGTGKTTTAITAATRAVQYGFRTCLLDLDPQGSASLAFGLMPGVHERIFCDIWEAPVQHVEDALRKLTQYLYLIPSSLDNEMLNIQLLQPDLQKRAVKGVCDVLLAKGFDLILIDCPPTLGTPVISTICAAETVVIPTCGDAFSRRGVVLTLQEIAAICQTFHHPLPHAQILYTRFDKRLSMSIQAFQELLTTYKTLCIPTPIRTSAEFAKALEKNVTVCASLRKSPAKADYDSYVRYILGLDTVVKKGVAHA